VGEGEGHTLSYFCLIGFDVVGRFSEYFECTEFTLLMTH
jgi:hypothetical protein